MNIEVKDWPIELKVPVDGLYVRACLHRIMNYRYHWHEGMYEINLVLKGKARCYAGKDAYDLEPGDLIIIDPLVSHASLALENETIALVLQFSFDYPSRFMRKNTYPLFHQICTTAENRDNSFFRTVRCYASDIMTAANSQIAKLNTELLIQHLLTNAEHSAKRIPDSFRKNDKGTQKIISYIDEHYFEKVTLEELSAFTGYNRTYLSSFFLEHTGMGFHDYLTRIRFQQALRDMYYTSKSLTDIALENGFSELKSFSTMFREILGLSPTEFLEQTKHFDKAESYEAKTYYKTDDPKVSTTLRRYSTKGC